MIINFKGKLNSLLEIVNNNEVVSLTVFYEKLKDILKREPPTDGGSPFLYVYVFTTILCNS